MNNILKLLAVSTVILIGSLGSVNGQTYEYVLLSDSTVTPTNGTTAIGPSQPVTGTFSWTADPGDSNATTFAYFVTSLDFEGSDFSVTDTSPESINDAVTDGSASFAATVNVSGALTGSYFLSSIDAGTFQGSPSAPTELTFDSVGVAPSGGGQYEACAFIDAQLVPEPSQTAMLLLGLGLLAFWRIRQLRTAQPFPRRFGPH